MISTITQSQIINYYHLLFIPNVSREAQIVAHDFLYCQYLSCVLQGVNVPLKKKNVQTRMITY